MFCYRITTAVLIKLGTTSPPSVKYSTSCSAVLLLYSCISEVQTPELLVLDSRTTCLHCNVISQAQDSRTGSD